MAGLCSPSGCPFGAVTGDPLQPPVVLVSVTFRLGIFDETSDIICGRWFIKTF
jgi:hypothetical protein